MTDIDASNYQCSNCRAKLLLKRRREPRKPREETFCPYCGVNLPPRNGNDTLQYTLATRPTNKRARDFKQPAKQVISVATSQIENRKPSSKKTVQRPKPSIISKK